MGQLNKVDVPPKKKRPRYSLDDQTIEKLEWLYEQDKKAMNKRIYQSDTLTKIIDDAYAVRKAFGN
ncbi:hypothetical protein OSF85_000557 [Enterococcus faecium]|uniref:hypothetical protein n=1 Tax=unclassified Enterococcus TaxID=2608891 RepID=UPI0028FDA31F|nr:MULTISPECIES: hypothetical protein [unclassified Enterococcus]EME7185809.1 hypothetical protein [Enterococcus faecium]MDU0318673.1 hypothetical protein [Enterococcus sp. 2STP]MDU0334050.1 hypothetical protein [Enterococcus sp. 2CBP]MDU0350148.1 hypothetical protein [Enterococcus sp. 3MOLP]MDU5602106.1 hypothetical protein [Enterococcus faecium]